MAASESQTANIPALDIGTINLARIAGAIAGGSEQTLQSVMNQSLHTTDAIEVEEVILQSYLFAGFPRALNAARVWRGVSGRAAPSTDAAAHISNAAQWQAAGEQTCAVVYGKSYSLLRENVRALHPALDAWMITDGYGKVLSRPQLDLLRRELCIIAACAVTLQQRQLHSHLHGALNCGATATHVACVLDSLGDLMNTNDIRRCHDMLARTVSQRKSNAS